MEFIACQYDSLWWVGLVQEINHEEQDILVKFMHTPLIYAFDKFICKIDTPTTMMGRMYQIRETD